MLDSRKRRRRTVYNAVLTFRGKGVKESTVTGTRRKKGEGKKKGLFLHLSSLRA